MKNTIKVGRIHTFEADFDTLPDAHDRSKQLIRPPDRAVRRFVADSGARILRQTLVARRPRFEAPVRA
jgi:hypothetical protein